MKSPHCEYGYHFRCNGFIVEMGECNCECHYNPEE